MRVMTLKNSINFGKNTIQVHTETEVDLNEADVETIAKIIDQFVEEQNKQHREEDIDEEDEFGDYVEPSNTVPHSNFYDDINWDFLAQKPKVEHPVHAHKVQEASPQKLIEVSPEKIHK